MDQQETRNGQKMAQAHGPAVSGWRETQIPVQIGGYRMRALWSVAFAILSVISLSAQELPEYPWGDLYVNALDSPKAVLSARRLDSGATLLEMATTYPDWRLMTLEWYFGDGAPGETGGRRHPHMFEPGEHVVMLRMVQPNGFIRGLWSFRVNVPDVGEVVFDTTYIHSQF